MKKILCLSMWLVCAIALGGCAASPQQQAMERVHTMRPEDFFQALADIRLAAAIDADSAERVAAAVDAKADVNAVGKDGMLPLNWAIVKGKRQALDALLKLKADPNKQALPGRSPMHTSILLPDPAILQQLLKAGGNPNLRKSDDGEPIVFACLSFQFVRDQHLMALLDAGADINARRPTMNEPLVSYAGGVSAWKVADGLLERGADPRATSKSGQTIVFYIERNPVTSSRQMFNQVEEVAYKKRVAERLRSMGIKVGPEFAG
jgi:ankyrin repeat protein